MKRTFIYSDDKSNKFWSIEVDGESYKVVFGKVGTAGQTQMKFFDSQEKCQKEAEKLIAEKTKKGYVETDIMPEAIPNTEKKSTKKYVTFVEEAYEKDDTDKEWGFEAFHVDINDPDSIIATLKAFGKKISDEETCEEWEGNGNFPHFGRIEKSIFYPLESNSEEDEEDEEEIYSESYFPSATFYRIAAECEQSRPELVKLCKQIIKINLENSGCPTWESEEHLLGVSQAFALAMADKKYINLAGEMMLSIYNGDHTTPDELVDKLFDKWGANDDTLEFAVLFITEMPLQDLYMAEEIVMGYFEDYLKEEKNINKFLEMYALHVVDSHSNIESVFEELFPDKDHKQLADKFTKLVEQKKVPTFKMLTTEQEEEEEITASQELFVEKVNTVLTDLNIEKIPEGKEYSYPRICGQYMYNGQHQIKVSKEYGYYELAISGVKTITEKDFNNETHKGNPETTTVANKVNAMLPDLKLLVGGIPSIRLNTRSRYKIYDTITSETLKEQAYAVVGCEDILTHYLTEINYNRLKVDEVIAGLNKMQASVTTQPQEITEFEQTILNYIKEIKEISILKHDKENHTIAVQYNNKKDGDSAGVITLYPLIQKISVTVPYYQGDIKTNEEEIGKWCESRERMCVAGNLVYDSESGYVWFRNTVDIETITDSKLFYDAIIDYLIGDSIFFAPLIKKVADGETAKEVLAYEDKKYNEKIAHKNKIDIQLPDDLRKIGIYIGEGERLLHAFMEYGKDFYAGKFPIITGDQEIADKVEVKETKKPSKSKATVIEVDNKIVVDINSVADMKRVLEMLINNIDQYSELAAPNDGLEFGHMVDGEFEMFEADDKEISEEIFFTNAAKHNELHELIIQYADVIDKDQFIDGISDMRMGMNAVYALAKQNEKYIPIFIEHHRKIRPGGGQWQMEHIFDLLSDTDYGLQLLAACCVYEIDNEDIECNIEEWMPEYVGDDKKKQEKLFHFLMLEATKTKKNKHLIDFISEALDAMGVEYDEDGLEETIENLDSKHIPKLSDIIMNEDEDDEDDSEPTKRTFIYSDEKSNKFWSIEVDECEYTVTYGKVGTNGQSQTKEFDDEEECIKAVEKLIKEKTKKGYVEE